ncbi:MAG: alpha/beta fold hydrolase [Acidobacteriaceae bacterium]
MRASTQRECLSLIDSFGSISLSDPSFEHERLRVITVRSRALGRRGDVSVWVPEADEISTLLILLHGVCGSHWSWALEGGVHHTAARMLVSGEISPLVIAMPSDGLRGDGSAWLTWPGAEDVERWVIDEVPQVASIAAPCLRQDAAVVIAGLSMGGYGALRLGAKYPEHFCGVSAHSAITDISEMANFVEEPMETFLATARGEELSTLYWFRRNRNLLPRLRFDCGTSDQLIGPNRALHAALLSEGIPHIYEESPGGHDWSRWQEQVPGTLRFAAPGAPRSEP